MTTRVLSSLPALLAAFLAVSLAAAPARAQPTRDYVVKPGDTCLGITNRELGDPKLLDELHRLNPGLGPSPHNLKAGQVLKLPVPTRTPDASLATRRGEVEIRQAGNADWVAGVEGQDLYRSWRVGTRAQASARIRFVDTSTIDMREDTVVVIFGPSAGSRQVARTSLERGALRAQLAKLDGKPRVAVETPAGTAELTEGTALVGVAAGGETRLANHGGAPARLAGKVGAPVAIVAGYGSKVAPGKAPEPPTPLPPPPAWAEPEGLMLGWTDRPTPVRGAWAPVAGASKYRIEIARANAPDAIEAQLEVPASITRLEASNLPAGEYEVRVATVDARGLEGVSSSARRVRVVELAPPAAAIAGAELAVPPGLSCAAGARAPEAPAAPAASVPLVREADGRARVTCAAGGATATLELDLPPVEIAPATAAAPRVRAGESFELELVASNVAPGALRAEGRGGIEVVAIAPTPSGVRLSLRAGKPAPDAAVVVRVGAAEPPIATVGVTVEGEAAAPPAAAGPPRWTRISAWGALGITSGRRGGDEVLGIAELAVDATRWIAPRVTIWGVGGGGAEPGGLLGVTLKLPGEVRPLLRLGGSLEDDRVGGHAGLGLEADLAPWLAWRISADGVLDRRDARVYVGAGLVLRR